MTTQVASRSRQRRLMIVGRGGGRYTLRLRRLADTSLAAAEVAGGLGRATHRLYVYELARADGSGGIAVTREVAAVVLRGAVLVDAGPVREPRACTSCLGEGVLVMRRCRHSGICPCTPDEIQCETCGGSGSVQCEFCGEDDGTVQTPGGLYCVKCAGEVGHG